MPTAWRRFMPTSRWSSSIATSRPGKKAAVRFLYPEIGALDAQAAKPQRLAAARGDHHQPEERAALAHDRQPALGAAARPRARRAARRHGKAGVESRPARLAGRGFRRARLRSEAHARSHLHLARLSAPDRRGAAGKGGVCLPRSAHAAADGGAVQRRDERAHRRMGAAAVVAGVRFRRGGLAGDVQDAAVDLDRRAGRTRPATQRAPRGTHAARRARRRSSPTAQAKTTPPKRRRRGLEQARVAADAAAAATADARSELAAAATAVAGAGDSGERPAQGHLPQEVHARRSRPPRPTRRSWPASASTCRSTARVAKPMQRDGSRNGRIALFDLAAAARRGRQRHRHRRLQPHGEADERCRARSSFRPRRRTSTRAAASRFTRAAYCPAAGRRATRHRRNLARAPQSGGAWNSLALRRRRLGCRRSRCLRASTPIDEGPGLEPITRKDFANHPRRTRPAAQPAVEHRGARRARSARRCSPPIRCRSRSTARTARSSRPCASTPRRPSRRSN